MWISMRPIIVKFLTFFLVVAGATAEAQVVGGATGSGGSGSNAAASSTGSAVPAAADYIGLSVGGTLRGATGISLGSHFAQTVAIVDGSGNQVTAFGGSGGTASNFGSTFPTAGTAVGFSDGTNMVAGTLLGTQADNVANTVDGIVVTGFNYVFDGSTWDRLTMGTAGSPTAQVLSVQGVGSMTPFLVNPGTAANFGIGATGSAVPANAAYNSINIGGTLRGQTGVAVGSHFAGTVAVVDGSGNQITSFGGSGGTASNYGSAFPSAGTAVGFSDGTNMVAGTIVTTQADNVANTTDGIVTSNLNYIFDGSTWDRWTGAVTQSGNWSVRAQDGSGNALASNANGGTRALAAVIYDGSGNAISSFGGSGGTAIADDGDFTAGTTNFTPVGGFYQSTVTACTDGDTCAAGITTGRALKVALAAADGSLLSLGSDGTHDTALGTITSVTGPMTMGRASAAAPTDVSADNDAVLGWHMRSGAYVNQPSFAGTLASTGNGASGGGVQRVTIANDSTGVLATVGTVTSLTQFNGNAIALNAGSASAGTLRSVTASDSPEVGHLSNLATYLQPGSSTIIRSDNTNNDDETQVKATAGVLLSISGRNAHTSTDAFVRCTNATAASTTPGSTAVIFEMMLPFGGGFVQSNLGPAGMTFSTALTCYVATGKAVTDTTDAAQDDVVVNIVYR